MEDDDIARVQLVVLGLVGLDRSLGDFGGRRQLTLIRKGEVFQVDDPHRAAGLLDRHFLRGHVADAAPAVLLFVLGQPLAHTGRVVLGIEFLRRQRICRRHQVRAGVAVERMRLVHVAGVYHRHEADPHVEMAVVAAAAAGPPDRQLRIEHHR